MKKYLAPLGVFASGMIAALLCYLFLPTLGTTADQLATDTAGISSVFWNWGLVSGNTVKFLVLISIILLTLFATAKAFLKVR